MDTSELRLAHGHSSHNKDELSRSSICGCFYCEMVYSPTEIKEWVDKLSLTALCPRCSIDSVIGDASGLPITESFLNKMHKFWFEH